MPLSYIIKTTKMCFIISHRHSVFSMVQAEICIFVLNIVMVGIRFDLPYQAGGPGSAPLRFSEFMCKI